MVSLGMDDMDPQERLVIGKRGWGIMGDPSLLDGDDGVRRLVDLQKYHIS